MHAYATDSPERTWVPVLLAVASVGFAYLVFALLRATSVSLPWWVESPSVLGIYGVLHTWFGRRLWRLRLWRRFGLVRVPDLSGVWKGQLISSAEGHRVPRPVELSVRQEWNRLLVTARTAQSRSASLAATLTVRGGDPELSYQYLNDPEPRAPPGMMIHRGTARLCLNASADELQGDYYTGRGRESYGSLRARRSSRS